MPVRARLLVVAIVSLLGMSAAAAPVVAAIRPTSAALAIQGKGSSSTSTVTSRGVRIPAFYSPPAALSKTNGALIRSEPLPLALRLPGLTGPLPGRATRLMYQSTDSSGRPVAVTGAYVEPTKSWRSSGPRPLVVVAPGTMGQGDQCAPSLALEHPLTLTTRTASAGYENLAIYRLLTAGIAVVVTDYVGLGTTDRLHTYVNRLDQAHAVLDAARAAHAVRTASITSTSPVGLYGYSQGGGATAAAAELQATYAPDVRLVGTYSGAPPADLAKVTRGIDGSDLAAAIGWAVNGLAQSYPEVRPLVATHVNAAGQAVLKDVSTMCDGEAILKYSGAHTRAWTTNGTSVNDIVAAEPVLQKVFAAQRIGTQRPTGPVRVATGVHDDLVPHAQARAMALSWCRLGGQVTYVPVRLPGLGRAILNHFAPLLADQGDAISWLTDRLAGKATSSNCATAPRKP